MSNQVSQESLFAVNTDQLKADLKGRSIRGGVLTLIAQGAKFILQMTSTVVLARLLTPADFGLVAMAAAVTGFARLIGDAGLSAATIQRPKISHDQISTLFWINVIFSLLLMFAAATLSPAMAWFYGEPRVTAIMLVVAGTFLFSGLLVINNEGYVLQCASPCVITIGDTRYCYRSIRGKLGTGDRYPIFVHICTGIIGH
jgi:hypothetical protein